MAANADAILAERAGRFTWRLLYCVGPGGISAAEASLCGGCSCNAGSDHPRSTSNLFLIAPESLAAKRRQRRGS